MSCHANRCVECTVSECANHCPSENYCSLDKILVGTHECNPTMEQCTDCMSFRRKSPGQSEREPGGALSFLHGTALFLLTDDRKLDILSLKTTFQISLSKRTHFFHMSDLT